MLLNNPKLEKSLKIFGENENLSLVKNIDGSYSINGFSGKTITLPNSPDIKTLAAELNLLQNIKQRHIEAPASTLFQVAQGINNSLPQNTSFMIRSEGLYV